MGSKKTHKEFLEEISAKGIQVEVLETYINSQTPLSCKCKKCGFVWKIRPNNLVRGNGCPSCGIEKRSTTRTKQDESFILELRTINPDISILEKYKGSRTPIECKCNKCEHIWKAAPTNLLKGRGCPVCGHKKASEKNKRCHSDCEDIIRSFGHDIEPLEKYKGNSYSIKMKCNVCGYHWSPIASSLVSGSGCPRCAGNGIYTQEEFTKKTV